MKPNPRHKEDPAVLKARREKIRQANAYRDMIIRNKRNAEEMARKAEAKRQKTEEELLKKNRRLSTK